MKIKHILECQFSSWYETWQNNTIKSDVIPLPKEFIIWLKEGDFITNAFPFREGKNEIDSDFYGMEDDQTNP